MIVACKPLELKASARGSSSAGTRLGVSACCAGIWNARRVPSAIDSSSSHSRCTAPCIDAAHISAATPA